MEEKKKKKQDEKIKIIQRKAAEPKAKVPDSVKVIPPPVESQLTLSSISNGRSCSPTDVQSPQCVPRFPPREVPPRFRQHEHKHLLKRGQPLPPAVLHPTTTTSPSNTLSEQNQKQNLTVLPHHSGQGAQHENSPWGIPTTSSSNCWDQVIIDEKDTEAWPSVSQSNSQRSLECNLDADTSEVVSSSMSMATGASQHSHYPLSKASINHSSSMVSSQGGPNRGWPSEGKTELSMGSRSQSNWGSPNLNLNPSANPAAWPVLGHEAPGVGSGPGGMGGSSSLPSAMCGPGGVAPVNGTSGSGNIGCANGNLVGDCAWGNPDTPEQHQSPKNMSFSMESSNLKSDGTNPKTEPMSPVNSWGGPLSQSPTEQASGDGTALWGTGDVSKGGESKDSGWDSGGVSSWGHGRGGPGWGEWKKQSSTEGKGWDSNDGPTQETMSSWGTDAPASEGSRGSSEGHSQSRERSSSMEFPLLPRQDLDPRVLCNSGWGQTPVRQHTVWEMDENSDAKDDSTTEAWGSSPNAPSTGSAPPPGCVNPNLNAPPRMMDSGSKNAPEPSRGMPTSGWGGSFPPTSQTSTGWGEPPANKKVSNGSVGNWGEPMADRPSTNGSSGQSWGSDEKSSNWEGPAQTKPHGWGDGHNASSGWRSSGSGNSGEWVEPSEGRKNGSGSSSWDGDGGNWKEPQRGWGKAAPASNGGWGDSQRSNGPVQGWSSKPQDSTSSANGVGNMGSWGGPNSVKQGGGSGWGSAGRQDPGEDTTGWEEPSPSSIRRKMEIDDGTSTWGDPKAYRSSVNMWDRNNPTSHQGNSNNSSSNNNHTGPGNNNHHHPHHSQGLNQNHSNGNSNGSPKQPGPPHNRPMVNPGWGDLPNMQTKPESSSWGEPRSSSPNMDNGTAAWGKTSRGSSSWGENCHESSGPYSRGCTTSGPAPCKPALKSMQDSWGSGGEEIGMSSSQWDAEDGDMWTSPTSQDSSSSCNSWNQSKKGLQKGKVPTKQDEVWIMNRLIKQLTDMGFPRDPAEEALRSNNMNLDQAMSALLEKKSEGDKRGMGLDYSSGMNKPLVCRPPNLSKDPPLDRAPFLDKDGGLSDDTPSSPFLPSPGLKIPLTNNSLPNHGMGGVSPGLTMQNLNNRQMNGMFGSNGAAQARALQQQAPPPQPPVPPLSSAQPNLRAQVPQFLSPQVQAQLLQFAAKNIGLNPALLTSPINPQQMTLLYQLQQLQMAYQRLQIQQQMMQAQRNVSGPIRQQEQQVARTINNMQQQIQQHQRQLAQALLMKQQQQQALPTTSHSGLHPNLAKPNLDVFPGNPQASGLSISDLQTKDQQSSSSSFSTYPLSGLNNNVGVACMDVGGLSLKDAPPHPQSRLSQWTHASSIDSLTTSTPHLETSLSKHGGTAPTHVSDSKPVMEDSFSPYNLLSSSQSPSSPLVTPESWTQGKSPNDKMSNGTNINWPPEFCPGVPWKGLQNIDPEADPNMTPGSVSGGPTINTNIQDVNRYLLRDRSGVAWSPTVPQSGAQGLMSEWAGGTCSGSFSLNQEEEEESTGKLLDMKSTWSAGPISHTQASMSHDLWKVAPGARTSTAPSRPPPGLTNTKHSQSWTSGSLGLNQSWSSSYSSGASWSSDNSSRTSSWLVLRNLTPQIDGSTLRTLCMQHGPLITFHLSLPQGNALVRYSSKDEAAKAQKSLHMCVLGNTTILAEFAGEEEVTRFFAQGQNHPPNSSWQGNAAPGSNQQQRMGNHWGSGGTAGSKTGTGSSNGRSGNGGDLLWGGVQQYSSLWGPTNGEETRVMGSPIPINTLLPGDLLSGENM